MTTTTLSMRDQMVKTLENLFSQDQRLALLLADISVSLFTPLAQRYPGRVLNLGIMEQTLISVAAGMALEDFIPVAHSIVPFLVERPFEQLKDDFCYQRLGGNFISTGASYDYSTEGMTHHGSGDVEILLSLPGMQIIVPGSAAEFDTLFHQSYANGSPTYYRMSATVNAQDRDVQFARMSVIKQCAQATVIAVGPMLDRVLEAVGDKDLTVLYCTTVAPFDAETLRARCPTGDIILVEPYYAGTLTNTVCQALEDRAIRVHTIGVPRAIPQHYGTPQQHDESNGLTTEGIRRQIEQVFIKVSEQQ